jgi:hypothetical protein
MWRKFIFPLVVAAAVVGVPAGATAADILSPMAPPGGYCAPGERSYLLDLPRADLRYEVERRYGHAVETAERQDVIHSSRPAHTWALETRQTCAKAIGYLKTSTVDEVEISKCACFYERMLRFMN